jgi:DNA-binding transcriptional ArsR family regulator
MNVGEIVTKAGVGHSTVSAHLKVLPEVGFVLAEHRGTATYYRINDACVGLLPDRSGHRHGSARSRPARLVIATLGAHR